MTVTIQRLKNIFLGRLRPNKGVRMTDVQIHMTVEGGTLVQTPLRSAYLAGPMRGITNYNFPEFHKQTAWLQDGGWMVVSPAERDEGAGLVDPDNPSGWADKLGLDYFMQFDLAAVCSTDCVVLLNGWETSQGARLEAMVAVEVGHPVFEIAEYTISGPSLYSAAARRLKQVDPERIAAEFIAGTVGWDGLPRLRPEVVTVADPGIISSVEPKTKADQDKLSPPLQRLLGFDTEATGPVLAEDVVSVLEEDVVSSAMRAFATGATRNQETDPDIHGFTSPLAIAMFARYMHENRTQKDGTLRDSDNWKKGIPLDSYIRSMRRHLQDLTLHHDGYADCSREDLYAALSGLFFNVQGYMHEVSKADIEQEREEEREDLLEEAVSIADTLNWAFA